MARKYAAVEFEGKECAVVPFIWLINNNQSCYWPKAGYLLKTMLEKYSSPDVTWPLFKVQKVLCVCGKLTHKLICTFVFVMHVCAYRFCNGC